MKLKFSLLICVISFISCDSTIQDKQKPEDVLTSVKDESSRDSLNLVSMNDLAISKNNFSEELKKMEMDSLPFSLNEELLTKCCIDRVDEQIIKDLLNEDSLAIQSYFNCSQYLKYDSLNFEDNLFDYIGHGEKFEILSCKVLKHFKRNEKIDFFLSTSYLNDYEFLFCFTVEGTKILDFEVLSKIVRPDDYNLFGLYINENFEIKSVNMSYYESDPVIVEKKLNINSDGEIITINENSYDISIEMTFHDYFNDYEVPKMGMPIDPEVRIELFGKMLENMPEVVLPYKIEKLDLVETVDSLKIDGIEYFFSNSTNEKTFRKRKKGYQKYDRGNFYKPIFYLQLTDQITVVGFTYLSFCNYLPTEYIKLNSYSKTGEIMDSLILNRHFSTSELIFESVAVINIDSTIRMNRRISNYEGVEKDSINEDYQISSEGKFIKL